MQSHQPAQNKRADRIIGLFKFGKPEDLEELRRGKLYLNNLGYFKKLEADDPRYDDWESADSVFAPGTIQLQTDDKSIVIPPDSFASHLRYYSDHTSVLHVFCMYAVLESKADALFKCRDFGFGESWVLFHSADEFLRRVRLAAEARELSFKCQLVEYLDESSFSGSMGPFRKRQKFCSESEARIVLGPGGPGPLRLEVGDLSDLIDPVRGLDDLSKRILIDYPSQREETAAG